MFLNKITLFIVAVAIVIASCHSLSLPNKFDVEFENFKQDNKVLYETKEDEAWRKEIFTKRLLQINEFNTNSDRSFSLGVNHLADKLDIELKRMNGLRLPSRDMLELMRKNKTIGDEFLDNILAKNVSVPDKLDWRKVPNRVSGAKDQGSDCGSCWAFASVGVLEGQEVTMNKKELVTLSEQELIDCSSSNYGCGGGIMEAAFNDLAKIGGEESEKNYPYIASNGNCRFDEKKVVMKDIGAKVLEGRSEELLKEVVAKYGPVSVGIEANLLEFYQYQGGYYYNPKCTGNPKLLDHAVLIVGYDNDPKYGDYWIVKNSWGTQWGENGFVKMARNRNNHCGIATVPTIAVL